MSAHGYDSKRFPLTPAQGRVLYHLERLFRSTGGGMVQHARYLERCTSVNLPAHSVQYWSVSDCIMALQLMEECAAPLRLLRDVRTGWQDFVS